MSEIADAELWVRAADDPVAFGEVFTRYARDVHSFCFWLTGDDHVADDLTSTVFLEAWRLRRRCVLEGSSLRPWLLGIARNCARNSERSRRRYRGALARLPKPSVSDVDEDTVVDRLDAAASLREASIALADLSAAEREVVIMVSWAGLSYAEAADVLRLPVGTVRSRISRARDKVRLRLDIPIPTPQELP